MNLTEDQNLSYVTMEPTTWEPNVTHVGKPFYLKCSSLDYFPLSSITQISTLILATSQLMSYSFAGRFEDKVHRQPSRKQISQEIISRAYFTVCVCSPLTFHRDTRLT